MSARTSSGPVVSRHGWAHALVTVIGALAAMGAVAALGLWAAGAADLPGGAFPQVLAATLVTAVGGTVRLSGDAGGLAGTEGGLAVIPLSVTLAGALAVGWGFLRPLRRRAVAGAPELGGWAARIAVLWLLVLVGLGLAARHTFEIPLGDGPLRDLGELFGFRPVVGFAADVPLTVLIGLVWLAGVLLVALMVSGGAPLPGGLLRFQASVRPAARAMVRLLLAAVVIALVVALVVAATRGHPVETFALILLGLPNVAWLALTVGLGATWDGRVEGPFGLPMPQVLDEVLRTPELSELNLGTLVEHDGARWWWLLVADAVLLLAAAFMMAALSPADVRVRQHAVRLAVALALTVLMICLMARVSARIGLSVLGIGDLGEGFSGEVLLTPRLWSALGLALLWGLAAGFAGASAARVLRRRGGGGTGR
ncbi:streptophobe family protein [Streptomyces pilosus]|uniref:streptophobe family protein n=1 Tax=Streptomyces pilosus TaxID=28893 RepID=UPI0016763142|nr:streptophobe family protein [Streptomyces pilosus]